VRFSYATWFSRLGGRAFCGELKECNPQLFHLTPVECPSFRRRDHWHRQPASHVHDIGDSVGCRIFVPVWPQLPRLSERESVIGQGLGIVADMIEPRNEGYGYQGKKGQIDSVLEILHRSSGELAPVNAAGFGTFEEALSSGLFRSATAVKGEIEGPVTLSAYLFHQVGPSGPILHFLQPSHFMSRRSSAGRLHA